MSIAVVVPVRAFDLGKSRLSASFTSTEREILARAMAEIVVAPRPQVDRSSVDWLIVCDDDRIESWATSRGARPLRVSAVGLNPSLDAARHDILRSTTAEWIVVAHADLPLADRLVDTITAETAVARADTVLIAPDRRHDGSNVVVIPRRLFPRWTFRYGPDSFSAHCSVAAELGAPIVVIDDDRLATDVDTIDDVNLVRDFITTQLPDWTAP